MAETNPEIELSDNTRKLFDAKNFATVATLNPDGSPPTSAVCLGQDHTDEPSDVIPPNRPGGPRVVVEYFRERTSPTPTRPGGIATRILVTGATGRIGSRFVPRLLQEGEPVRVLVRDAAQAERFDPLAAEVVVGDLRRPPDTERALADIDAVVHLAAAFRGVPDQEAVATNQTATVEFARLAARSGVRRFVYASTNLVYGKGGGRPARETDEPAPTQRAYPQTKLAAENALLDLHRAEGLPLRIVRLAFVYGYGDPHLAESLHWARNWPLDKRLHLIHHADVAQALIRAIRTDGVDGGIFNAADDAPVTTFELFNLNREPISEDGAARTLDDPWDGIVETTVARRQLGFRPVFPTVYTAIDAGAL